MVNESDPLQLSFGLTLMQIIDVVRDSLCFILGCTSVSRWLENLFHPNNPEEWNGALLSASDKGEARQERNYRGRERERFSPASCDCDKGGFMFFKWVHGLI